MQDKRRYVRMNTVFPVEFEITAGNGNQSTSGLLQGFTRDVSEGGMCIEFKTFAKHHELALNGSRVCLELTINPTFSIHPIKATASVIWLKKEKGTLSEKYLIGVSYDTIDGAARRRIIRHAKNSVWVPRIAFTGALLLIILLIGLWAHDQKLVSENRKLVQELHEDAQKRSQVSQDLQGLDHRKEVLEEQLASALGQVEQMQKIQNELDEIHRGRKDLEDAYQRLAEEGRADSQTMLQQMGLWLKSHQNLRSGLVASFEGDPALEHVAFTYDQALAAQVFLLQDDLEASAAVLSFFSDRAPRSEGVFFNAYDTLGGGSAESLVHTGPNIWLGIAALQYENRTKDGRFLPLAIKIGDWALSFQDAEGGLRGGPNETWYSTEHNLDAYEFFGLLHRVTGKEKYKSAQERSLAWIKKYAYSNKEGRVHRGKGDATIATDTFGWAIAAIGPEKLKSIDLDPDAIMDFAQKNCLVTVGGIQGFDFAKAQNIGRGGVISTEWTAQMCVSYQMMARYYRAHGDPEKAAQYLKRSNLYLDELQKMMITSPSKTGQGRGCLPYASAENVDTGHGWRTPKGASTGSVAATAYDIFAWKGYNPFELGGSDAGTS